MHTLNRETKQLKHMIQQKISHSYVEKFIQKPLIDFDKLTILHYLYKDSELPAKRKLQYMTTIMLVQIALDTHELVPKNGSSEMSAREKQLSVLAGDYYSGLYYLLLSDIGDIKMIQVLATAIQKINEKKMVLFYENVETIGELTETVKDIESLLFTDVASLYEESAELIPFIEEILLINRLYKEKELIVEHKTSSIEAFIRKNVSNLKDDAVALAIDDQIDISLERLGHLLPRLPYRFLAVENMVRNKIKLAYNTTSIAEEG